MIIRPALIATAIAAALLPSAEAEELGINVYGASYHFERDQARENDLDNEFNPGLGLRYRFAELDRWSFHVDAGFFRDSGRHTAQVLGAAAMYKLGAGFHAGAAISLFHSDTYNDGDAFVAPVPLLAYDFGLATVNATFFPKVSNFNDIPTLGFWLTIPLWER